MLTKTAVAFLSAVLLLVVSVSSSQERPTVALGDGPWYYETQAPEGKVRVSIVSRGINHPWGMEFLPSGDILIAQRGGELRVIRDGKLDPSPITGTPEVAEASSGGLMDLRLHPDFATNRLLYFTYVKGAEPPPGADYYATTVLARGRLNEAATALLDTEDVFVANAWDTAPGGHGSRLLFAPDGTIFFSSPFRRNREQPQNTMSDISKLLRVNDDGSIPPIILLSVRMDTCQKSTQSAIAPLRDLLFIRSLESCGLVSMVRSGEMRSTSSGQGATTVGR